MSDLFSVSDLFSASTVTDLFSASTVLGLFEDNVHHNHTNFMEVFPGYNSYFGFYWFQTGFPVSTGYW